MAAVVDRVDDFQRGTRSSGSRSRSLYKFFDDQGNYLAAIVTYYAFIAIFPLLLIASSVLGFLLQGDAELRQAVLTSALSQFPIVGTQLGAPRGPAGQRVGGGHRRRSPPCTACSGSARPRRTRSTSRGRCRATAASTRSCSRLRSFVLMILAGVTVLLVAMLSSAASHLSMFGAERTSAPGCCSCCVSVA